MTKPLLNKGFVIKKVGMARFELATSWSQTRRDNRATLHPELLDFILYHLALMQPFLLLGNDVIIK